MSETRRAPAVFAVEGEDETLCVHTTLDAAIAWCEKDCGEALVFFKSPYGEEADCYCLYRDGTHEEYARYYDAIYWVRSVPFYGGAE